MLYVSKRVGNNKIGVVDTDDGVETIIDLREARRIVQGLGIEIKGIELEQSRPGKFLMHVTVYQNADDVDKSLVKLRALKGIEIKRNGTEITSIMCHGETNVVVRLSDYGTHCADYLFRETNLCKGLTLVFDDKITVSPKAFRESLLNGAIYDLRELSNETTAKYIYSALLDRDYVASVRQLTEKVLDNYKRLDYWRAVCVLNFGYSPGEIMQPVSRIVHEPGVVQSQIDKAFVPEFLKALRGKMKLKDTTSAKVYVEQYVKWESERNNQYLKNAKTYDILRGRIEYTMKCVARTTGWRHAVSYRLDKYLLYFEVADEVKEELVKFYHRAHEFMQSSFQAMQ